MLSRSQTLSESLHQTYQSALNANRGNGSAVSFDGNGRLLSTPSGPSNVVGPLKLLTPAETNVAGLVAQGSSNGEIAHRLGISRHTVESHLKHVFVKLGISSRVQLAVLVAKAAV